MPYTLYNDLISKTSDEEFNYKNFIKSLNHSKNATTFNSLINIISYNNITYEILENFNYISNDTDISNFNKIVLRISNKKDMDIIKNILQDNKQFSCITGTFTKDKIILKINNEKE